MRNQDYKQPSVDNITVELITSVFEAAISVVHTSYAPLGCSGDEFMLFGEPRRKEVSLRLHSGDVKLLVTDDCGSFLFYGGFDRQLLPISFIARQYFEIIQNVKHLLDNTESKSSLTEFDKEEIFKRQPLLRRFITNH